MHPIEQSCSWIDSHRVLLSLYVPDDLFWFKGHFADYPVLPGVAQIDWAIQKGIALFALSSTFCGIESVKFQAPIPKNATLQLELVWHAERQVILFTYTLLTAGKAITASTGKIKLCA